MQNEELRRVFNLSEHQNHRYNGYLPSTPTDRSPAKSKKFSPKKKNQNMVTSLTKPAVKRRPKLKNSMSKADDVIVNGVSSLSNLMNKTREPYLEKYRSDTSNHVNNTKSEGNSLESIDSILSKLNKDADQSTNHHMRLTSIKYADVNHARSAEISSNINYSPRIQYINSDSFDSELNVNNVSQKFNNFPVHKTKKSDEFKVKNEEYLPYLSNMSSFKLPTNNSEYDDFTEKVDLRFSEIQKYSDTNVDKKLPDWSVRGSCENKLFLRAKRRKQNRSKWQMDGGTRHEALQRIRECIEQQENLQNDLYPLNLGETGYDKSDSDSSEEYGNTFQHHWFHSMSEIEFDDVKRNLRLNQLYCELRRQLCQIKQNKHELPTLSEQFMKSLVDLARTRPTDTFRCLESVEEPKATAVEPLILAKKKCAVEACKNVALPCMSTCIRHVLLCEKQMLFEQCRVRDSNSFQCDRPVLNIKYHYPVCSVHSKPDFVLPDFSRTGIKYEDVRQHRNACTSSVETYKTDFDFASATFGIIASASVSSKNDNKKRNNVNSSINKHQFSVRSQHTSEKEEREKKLNERKDNKIVKNEESKPKLPVFAQPKEVVSTVPSSAVIKEEPPQPIMPEVNPNILRDWVNLSETQLEDAKTLETTLPNDFVNGFDMNSSSIQSQIQDIINSESSLSTDILMGTNELPNYIQVEEMIEEVEITDETLDSTELGNQELVHSEDLNAVLKQLPPEAFNELFSEFTLSES